MNRKIRIYKCCSNGANKIEILDRKGKVLETIENELFGVQIEGDFEVSDLHTILDQDLVSPAEDGSHLIAILAKYL